MKKTVVMVVLALTMVAVQSFVQQTAINSPQQVLRHVVMFKFTSSATPAIVKDIENTFKALPLKIPSVKGFEWGTNNSPEGFNEGLTHCFVVSFDDEKGRQAYWDNPAHNDFVNNHLKPYMEKVLVIDYFVNQ